MAHSLSKYLRLLWQGNQVRDELMNISISPNSLFRIRPIFETTYFYPGVIIHASRHVGGDLDVYRS